ncbi:hypothetical protein A9C11_22985 [Pseudomonas citronellolis]|uniref:Uncharacterized protein n=1 Tax=Pseudomonas citronellolis TaxID=53408 RepID=A0A1A9KGK7_9PSED|nr:hypothetical protein [Pseudomonas citronellolis]ANI16655.1 hypothetical protein A9C11_22985 [Pseudomonas citronellolis]
MSFVTREIELTFRLPDGALNDRGQDKVSLRGHRVELILAQSGGILTLGELQLRVFGMKMTDMNKFSTNQLHALAVRGADISVSAGDLIKGIKKIFDGTMIAGVVNYSGAPDVAFDLNARPGYLFQVAPAAANSYEGSTDVATIIEALAKQMGVWLREPWSIRSAEQSESSRNIDPTAEVGVQRCPGALQNRERDCLHLAEWRGIWRRLSPDITSHRPRWLPSVHQHRHPDRH